MHDRKWAKFVNYMVREENSYIVNVKILIKRLTIIMHLFNIKTTLLITIIILRSLIKRMGNNEVLVGSFFILFKIQILTYQIIDINFDLIGSWKY